MIRGKGVKSHAGTLEYFVHAENKFLSNAD